MKLLLQALNDMKDGIKAKKKVKLAAFKKALKTTINDSGYVTNTDRKKEFSKQINRISSKEELDKYLAKTTEEFNQVFAEEIWKATTL